MKKALLTAVLAFIGSVVFAQERIAVFPFEDMDNIFVRNESRMFYDEFINAVKNRMPDRTIVPRDDVEGLFSKEYKFQLTKFSEQEKTGEMERVLNGTQILSGRIGKLGNEIRVTVYLCTYPELDWLPGGNTVSVANTKELFSKIPELVQQMQNIIADGNQPIPEGLKYEIVDGKTFTIIGYTGNAATVNIPSRIAGFPVTSIGEYAFSDCRNLTSVTIPSSVTSIGNWAFEGLEKFTSITVDNRNTMYASIDGVLFDKNIQTLIKYPPRRNQRTYVIPSSVMFIEDGAFSGCKNLTSVTIPSSVTSIGFRAFQNCSSLTSITIPSSVMSIGNWAFFDCGSLTSVTIPSSVTSIGIGAFRSCGSLTSITIPSSVTSIGGAAFEDCRSLTSITIPASVTSIGDWAFADCGSLTSVTIPSSVTSIGVRAFQNCSRLTSVTLSRRTQVGERAFPASARISYRD